MKYDFDELVERRGTGCVTWDESPNKDVIPLWVADMDFKAAPAIQEAIRKRAEHGVIDRDILTLPERVLRQDVCVVNLHVLAILEHIFRIAFQSIDVDVLREHERVGAPMQHDVLQS